MSINAGYKSGSSAFIKKHGISLQDSCHQVATINDDFDDGKVLYLIWILMLQLNLFFVDYNIKFLVHIDIIEIESNIYEEDRINGFVDCSVSNENVATDDLGDVHSYGGE